MTIKNCTNAVNAYKAAAYDKEQKTRTPSGAKEKNTDKVEFSVSRNNTDSMKASAVKSAEAAAPAERIAALKSLIAEGKYAVPSESIALSILEG